VQQTSGADVLDLYAGSGSLGLESLSRGASDAVFVEKSRSAVEILRANIERVGLGGKVRNTDVAAFLRSERGRYGLIFLDPPYSADDKDVGLVIELLDAVLTTSGIVVLHRQARSVVVAPNFLHTVDERRYGDAVITMMERQQE